jgi:hypothetical protein
LKWLVVVAAALAALWYGLVAGRRMDEQMVRDYYQAAAHAVLSRNPEAQCKLLGKSATIHQDTLIAGQTKSETLGQAQACDQIRHAQRFFEEMGEKAGGILTIEYDYALGTIDISPDRKAATIEFTSTLKMGETFMQFRTTSTDRLVRRWGSVELIGADAKTRVSFVPGAMVDPARYFQSQ